MRRKRDKPRDFRKRYRRRFDGENKQLSSRLAASNGLCPGEKATRYRYFHPALLRVCKCTRIHTSRTEQTCVIAARNRWKPRTFHVPHVSLFRFCLSIYRSISISHFLSFAPVGYLSVFKGAHGQNSYSEATISLSRNLTGTFDNARTSATCPDDSSNPASSEASGAVQSSRFRWIRKILLVHGVFSYEDSLVRRLFI